MKYRKLFRMSLFGVLNFFSCHSAMKLAWCHGEQLQSFQKCKPATTATAIENPSLPSHLEHGIGHSIELPGAMLRYSFCIHGEGWPAQANPPKTPKSNPSSGSETFDNHPGTLKTEKNVSFCCCCEAA